MQNVLRITSWKISAVVFLVTVTLGLSSSIAQEAVATRTSIPSQPRYHTLSSGTGFFVGALHVVTNEHVVRNCKQIKVRGAVQDSTAHLVAIDKRNDLALLQTDIRAPRVAYLRSNSGLRPGDGVTVIGYPMEHGLTGQYAMATGTIIDVNHDFEGIQSIEFTDSVQKGNSGGPLLDRAGNVIGVVVGKVSYYIKDDAHPITASARPLKVSSVAIGLPALSEFLRRNNVMPQQNSTYDIFTDMRPDKRAQQYIVNVHCIQN